jgi:hypothetical protein
MTQAQPNQSQDTLSGIHMDGRGMQQHRIEHILQDGFREFLGDSLDALELTEREKVMLLIIRRTIAEVKAERNNLKEFEPIYLGGKFNR